MRGAEACKSDKSRQAFSIGYLASKIGVDTAVNEPLKVGSQISPTKNRFHTKPFVYIVKSGYGLSSNPDSDVFRSPFPKVDEQR